MSSNNGNQGKKTYNLTELTHQVGGDHYQKMSLQPAEFCFANMSIEEIKGAMRWNIQKYIWRDKGGVEDLRKAQHYLEMWISAEERYLKEQRRSDPDRWEFE